MNRNWSDQKANPALKSKHQNHRLGTVSNELLGGGGLKLVLRAQSHPP